MIFQQLKELIRKEILILIRDRQTVMLLFLMPVALIFFLSLALEGVWTDKMAGRKIQIVVKNESHSPKANLLEKKIKVSPQIQTVDRPSRMDKDEIVADGKTQAVVTIPPGFEDGDRPVEIYFDPVIDAGYKIAARSLITSLIVEVVMGIDNLDTVISGLIVEKTKPNRDFPTPLQQTVPAYAIFAMFFIAIPMSIGFIREKTDGTLQRLFNYPVNANMIALGKVIPYYFINLAQFALMLMVGVFLMPRILGMPFYLGEYPWYLIPVTLIVAASSTAFGVLVASLARSPEQSSTLAATASVLMAVFGGIMVPHVVMPLFMKKLAMVSPMYWAHQAYLDVFLRDASFVVIAPKLIVLTVFAGICFYIAGRRVQWI